MQGHVVAVMGADTRLGQAVSMALEGTPHQALLFTQDSMEGNPVKFTHSVLSEKKPNVVINCLADPDGGLPPSPDKVMRNLIAPTHAMVQQAMALGSRFIHLSSSRVFGQSLGGRLSRPYYCYDPAAPSMLDAWAGVLGSLERTVLLHTADCSPSRWKYGSKRASFVMLRVPHVIHPVTVDRRPNLIMTLEMALRSAIAKKRESTFAVSSQHTILGMLSSRTMAAAVVDSINPELPSGIYQISSAPVTVQEIFNQLMLTTDRSVSLVPEHASGEFKAPVIYGISHDSAMSSRKWLKAGCVIKGDWKGALKDLVRCMRRDKQVVDAQFNAA